MAGEGGWWVGAGLAAPLSWTSATIARTGVRSMAFCPRRRRRAWRALANGSRLAVRLGRSPGADCPRMDLNKAEQIRTKLNVAECLYQIGGILDRPWAARKKCA